MATNSSTLTNTSSHFPCLNVFDCLHFCWNTQVGTLGITLLTILNNLIVLPLCISVLYVGVKRCQQQSKTMSVSHSDIFTYHIVIMELMYVLGSTLSCFGVHTNIPLMQYIGMYLFAFVFSGQMMFHILTCVERYLAVVHPITYLALKSTEGIRMRNVTIACVWLICLIGLSYLSLPQKQILTLISFVTVSIALLLISLCSVSVLLVLVSPGPGRKGGIRQKVNQSKLKAFHTIVAILSVLLIRFGGNVCVQALLDGQYLYTADSCAVWLTECWLSLPSSLVLPLLFLHRAKKKTTLQKKNLEKIGSSGT